MADQQFAAIAAQYADEAQAVADFDRMIEHPKDSDHKHDFFDAALIRRGLDGQLTVVKREDSGKHRSTKKGLKIGLATGIAAALISPWRWEAQWSSPAAPEPASALSQDTSHASRPRKTSRRSVRQ